MHIPRAGTCPSYTYRHHLQDSSEYTRPSSRIDCCSFWSTTTKSLSWYAIFLFFLTQQHCNGVVARSERTAFACPSTFIGTQRRQSLQKNFDVVLEFPCFSTKRRVPTFFVVNNQGNDDHVDEGIDEVETDKVQDDDGRETNANHFRHRNIHVEVPLPVLPTYLTKIASDVFQNRG